MRVACPAVHLPLCLSGRRHIASPQAGVFARLRDRTLFEQVHIEMGAVVWPGELDLAPDAMHAAIKEHGEWTIAP